MLAQGPTCALARVSYMTSTRPNAQVNHYPNGPILHRDMAPFYSAIDKSGGQWQGTVGVAEHLGSDTFFHIHNTGLTEMLTVRAIGDVSLTHGDTIHLTPRTGEIHRFDAGGLRIA